MCPSLSACALCQFLPACAHGWPLQSTWMFPPLHTCVHTVYPLHSCTLSTRIQGVHGCGGITVPHCVCPLFTSASVCPHRCTWRVVLWLIKSSFMRNACVLCTPDSLPIIVLYVTSVISAFAHLAWVCPCLSLPMGQRTLHMWRGHMRTETNCT